MRQISRTVGPIRTLGLLLLLGLGVVSLTGATQAVSTPTPLPATPSRVANLPLLKPEVLEALLNTTQLLPEDVPVGFSTVNVGTLSEEDWSTLQGLGVDRFVTNYVVDFPTTERFSNSLIYLIYRTNSAAATQFEDFWHGAARQGYVGMDSHTSDYPATVLSTQVLLPTNEYGYDAWAVVQAANVLIVGHATIPGTNESQAETNAVDLAQSGVTRLERLVAGPELQRVQNMVSATEVAISATEEAATATAEARAVAQQTAMAAVTIETTVTAYDIYFEPPVLTIPANTGVKVELPNEGVIPHNFSIDALDISVHIQPGETQEVVINAPPGTYEYYCDMPGHEQAGMVGTLTID